MSIPRTFTSRHFNRKPTRLTLAVAGSTVAAAALVAVGIATANPGGPGAPVAFGTALTAHGSASAVPIAGIAMDQAGSAPAGSGGHASPHLAGGLSAVTASGRAILASGQAAAHAAAQPARSAPAAHSAKRAPAGHPAKAAGRKAAGRKAAGRKAAGRKAAGQHASGARTGKRAHLDRSARKVHHAAPAHKARHTGPCASSTLHWWICSAEHALEQHGVSRALLSTNAAYIVVQHESGANPHAYNGWDSNAAAGHPSEGIAQVIGPTFQAYALPGHHNIWNPVDNMIAAFRYAISRYGSMNNIPGVAAVRQGGSYMGY